LSYLFVTHNLINRANNITMPIPPIATPMSQRKSWELLESRDPPGDAVQAGLSDG